LLTLAAHASHATRPGKCSLNRAQLRCSEENVAHGRVWTGVRARCQPGSILCRAVRRAASAGDVSAIEQEIVGRERWPDRALADSTQVKLNYDIERPW